MLACSLLWVVVSLLAVRGGCPRRWKVGLMPVCDEGFLCGYCHQTFRAGAVDICTVWLSRGETSVPSQWCSACARRGAFGCQGCSELAGGLMLRSVSDGVHWVDGVRFCTVCAERFGWDFCEDCCNEVSECRCDEAETWEDDDTPLHNYSYKPAPVFSGSGPLFMGVELETEGNGDRVGRRVLELNGDRDLYCKDDGSLCDGCEIVSHPRDLEAWRDFSTEYGSILSEVSEAGGRAWDRSSAGLHIHVSRDAFGSSSHLARFCWLWGRNEARVVRYAGRQTSYASFEDLRYGGLVKKCGRGVAGGHSAAVNLSNVSTVEIRVFRPSLAVGRVFSYLEAVHASWLYTSTLRASDVALGALTWDRFTSYVLNGEDFPVFSHHLRGGRFRTSETLAGSLVGARDLVPSFDGEV